MMRRFVPEAATARHAAALGFVLFALTGGAALAQTTGAVDPAPARARAPATDDMPPPGGCTPIGLTVSGEIVFPFACKGFIERQKAMAPPSAAAQEQRQAAQDQPTAVDGKPAVADDNPATAPDKPAAMQEQPAAALDKPAGVEDKPAAQEEKPAATAEQPVVPDQKPAATAEKSAVPDEKPAATQTGSAAPELSRPEAIRPGETIPLPRRAEQKRTQLAMDPMCKHFRSYNPGAGTYKGFDGRMRPCK